MFKRLLCIALTVLMLIGTISMLSCSAVKIKLNDAYQVVVGDELYSVDSEAPAKLSQALEIEGISAELVKSEESKKGEFEILVGLTDREESQKAYEKLEKIDDFIVDPIDKSTIVICGKTPLATEKAVQFFLDEYLHAGEGEFDGQLFVAGQTHFKQEYAYESALLENISVRDFVIAVDADANMRNAYRIAHSMGKASGEVVKIVGYSELSAENKGVVCLESNGREPQTPVPEGLDGYFLNLESDGELATLSVCWTRDIYMEEAIAKFDERFAVYGDEKVGEVRFTSITSHEIRDASELNKAKWSVVSEVRTEITDGVTQVTYTCKGFRDLPYLVHVMTVDLDCVDLMLGTADNRVDCEDKWIQTPVDHAIAAKNAGHKVYAGINAGYPTGISIKDGYLLCKGTIHRPYFAMTKAGEPVILYDDNAADVKNLQLAACGTDVLVDNYLPGELRVDDEFSYTTHPRTMIGIRGDGKVIMVVIDGRQPELSNGAPFVRCADIMMQLGCKYALNLDGGGSSAMFYRPQKGGYRIVNKISDPVMRQVRNSILIIEKKDQ